MSQGSSIFVVIGSMSVPSGDSMAKASLIYSPTMPVSFSMAARSVPALKVVTLLRKSPAYFFRRAGGARAPGLNSY